MKKFPLLLCALALLLTLTACGAAEEIVPSDTAAPTVTAAPTETPVPTPTPEPVSLYGVWKYDDAEQYIDIEPDGWSIYTADGLYRTGLCEVDEQARTVTLTLYDGLIFPTGDGTITFGADTGTDWDGDILRPSALPESFPASVWDEIGLTGVWKYDDYPIWYVICPGGGWTQYTTDFENYGDTWGSVLERSSPMLYNDSGYVLLTPGGDTAVDDYGQSLHRVAALDEE